MRAASRYTCALLEIHRCTHQTTRWGAGRFLCTFQWTCRETLSTTWATLRRPLPCAQSKHVPRHTYTRHNAIEKKKGVRNTHRFHSTKFDYIRMVWCVLDHRWWNLLLSPFDWPWRTPRTSGESGLFRAQRASQTSESRPPTDRIVCPNHPNNCSQSPTTPRTHTQQFSSVQNIANLMCVCCFLHCDQWNDTRFEWNCQWLLSVNVRRGTVLQLF